MVPKPHKLDMTSPKSYCPISLIECLSKLGKKMMATQMQTDSVKFGLLPDNQFGGLLNVGTNDAGLALRHNIEEAWAWGKYCAVIAANVKQFFPLLSHARLVYVILLYSYLPQVTVWLASFLANRLYTFCIGGIITSRRPFHGRGVPQGSLLSPILAATYITAVTNTEGCQVYMDDACLKGYHSMAHSAAL